MRPILLAVLAAVVAQPALAADQFDLVCQGQRRWAADAAPEPVTIRYRVDTKAGAWCREECFTVDKLVSAGPDGIVFSAKKKNEGGDENADQRVNLASGAWTDFYEGPYPPGDYWRTEGRCATAPFSGVPAK